MRFLYTFVTHLPANIFTFVSACALGSMALAGAMVHVQERPLTLEFHLVDEGQHSGKVPPSDKLYQLPDGSAILLKRDVVASGDDVAEAVATTTPEGPAVYIRLDARGAASMLATTHQNLGHRLAVVYRGRVINAAVIQGVFGARLEVADLTTAEARSIAMHFGETARHGNEVPLSLRQRADCMYQALKVIPGVNHPVLRYENGEGWNHPVLGFFAPWRDGVYQMTFEAKKPGSGHDGYWFLHSFAGPPPPGLDSALIVSVTKAWKARCQADVGFEIN